MAANKVVLNDEVLIDLTNDTVTEDDVKKGVVFHKPDGTQAVGVGGGFEDVTELPTVGEAGTVYRMGKVVETDPQGYFVASGMKMTFEEFCINANIPANLKIHLVDTLPSTMEPMNEATLDVPLYVVKETGIAFVSLDGTPENAMTFGMLMEIPDKGWTDDIASIDETNEAEWGMYFVRGENQTIYALYCYTDGTWIEYVDSAPLNDEINALQDEIATANASIEEIDTLIGGNS